MKQLFNGLKTGKLDLKNRIVMAPMTRSRAGQPGNIPTELMATYYAQRAGAGLIITEATQISPQAQGYAWTPGIHSGAQVEGWKNVVGKVHDKGGKIIVQLWHVGRISHSALQPQNALPVAPSAIAAEGNAFITDAAGQPKFVPFETPRALEKRELAGIALDFANAARNAMAAGFDGVEVHGANGYLLDQFLNTSSNQREDEYGGSVENRARFLLEVTDAVVAAIGADRVGVRISPYGSFNSMQMDDPEALFSHLVTELNQRGLAYLHAIDPRSQMDQSDAGNQRKAKRMLELIRKHYDGALILAGGFSGESAAVALAEGQADLIAFGKPFISNPDLPERLLKKAALAEWDANTFYGGSEKGYTDYRQLSA
ncbi:alkene reductase [Permianibacter aggregans]|uniref:N-ethylmaleimide reductase n=1 Tax=Permianibacter aggregans TaxID=1510150 RepID=A0A4V3D7L2_9GAMM|nr:alkene reductase [Permianibacter aggregans]QGX40903.1 alkene reductase [Permianibacter aggregans]TDQ48277.1 N-ethylmaleimide reductase [Permianibacter aggregans]